MNNDLYQHEAIQQLAKEFGLEKMTAREISEDEIKRLLEAIGSEHINPDHDSPAKWVKSFFMFLRQTGKFPEMLESPRVFVQQIIYEYRYR
jgi:hypothetical protein